MTTQNGMVPADQWRRTAVHQVSNYSCGKCGKRFDSPEKVYDHIDEKHPPKATKR